MAKPIQIKKQVYVIMPYGNDDNRDNHDQYDKVFNSIIKPAAQKAGYKKKNQIFREIDLNGEGGIFPIKIVRHIAESEIVIADLSDNRANVFYELGISHVFHKSTTVLICNRTTTLASDIDKQSVLFYGVNIDTLANDIEKISAAIKKRRQTMLQESDCDDTADNVVHLSTDIPWIHLADALKTPENPILLQHDNERLNRKVKELEDKIHELERSSTTPKISSESFIADEDWIKSLNPRE